MKREILQSLKFGARIAEEETEDLATYFVETDHWRRLFSGEIDIIYGPKGSGKSALYSLLQSRNAELFDRSILIAPAENPRGATVFGDLVSDPPTTEQEFIGLWKLYFSCVLFDTMTVYGIRNDALQRLADALGRDGLLPVWLTLS